MTMVAPPGVLRVLIADDHAPTRDDIRRALTDGGLVVCAEAADAARAVQQALETKPDICLLDVRMPGGGVAAAWEIAARLPTTSVVMLTVSDEDGGPLPRALRAGAVSYLVKDIDLDRPAPSPCVTSPKAKRPFLRRSSLAWSCQFHSNDQASDERRRNGRFAFGDVTQGSGQDGEAILLDEDQAAHGARGRGPRPHQKS